MLSPTGHFRPATNEDLLMRAFPAWKTPRLRAAFLGLAAASAMLAHGALAQESGGELRKLCADDFKKYCAEVKPGNGALRACMQQNFDKLSEACRTGIEERRKNKPKS
jgi:cysteine rich repeat protein